jgi:hypothetical protein
MAGYSASKNISLFAIDLGGRTHEADVSPPLGNLQGKNCSLPGAPAPDFPTKMLALQEIIWERATLGALFAENCPCLAQTIERKAAKTRRLKEKEPAQNQRRQLRPSGQNACRVSFFSRFGCGTVETLLTHIKS